MIVYLSQLEIMEQDTEASLWGPPRMTKRESVFLKEAVAEGYIHGAQIASRLDNRGTFSLHEQQPNRGTREQCPD